MYASQKVFWKATYLFWPVYDLLPILPQLIFFMKITKFLKYLQKMEFLIKYEYIRMIENIHPCTSLQPVPLATRQGNPKLEVLDVLADNACGLVQAWQAR